MADDFLMDFIRDNPAWSTLAHKLAVPSKDLKPHLVGKPRLSSRVSNREVVSHVHRLWYAATEGYDEPKQEGLPGTIVKVDGTAYHIHGIFSERTGLAVSPEFWEGLKSQVLENAAVLTEPRHKKHLSGVTSATDLFQTSDPAEFTLQSRLEHEASNPIFRYAHGRKSLSDMKDLRGWRNLGFRLIFPEPLGMNEYEFLNERELSSEKGRVDIINTALRDEDNTTVAAFLAGAAMLYARENKLTNLHLIVEYDREQRVALFLRGGEPSIEQAFRRNHVFPMMYQDVRTLREKLY